MTTLPPPLPELQMPSPAAVLSNLEELAHPPPPSVVGSDDLTFPGNEDNPRPASAGLPVPQDRIGTGSGFVQTRSASAAALVPLEASGPGQASRAVGSPKLKPSRLPRPTEPTNMTTSLNWVLVLI